MNIFNSIYENCLWGDNNADSYKGSICYTVILTK